MPLTRDEIESIVANFKYKNIKIEYFFRPYEIITLFGLKVGERVTERALKRPNLIVTSAELPDTLTGEPIVVASHSRPPAELLRSPEHLLHFLRRRVQSLILHDLDENIEVCGQKQYFDPHETRYFYEEDWFTYVHNKGVEL